MRHGFFAVIAAIAASGAASAQAPLLFPADSYGQANKAFSESSQNQAVLEVLMGKQDVFEPVSDMFEGDSFRLLGRSVGMLDLLVEDGDGRRANSTCTATLIAADRAITNHHCIPGNEWRTVGAQLRLGFLDRANAPGDLFAVTTQPIEANAALDYAIFEVRGVPVQRFPPARIAPRAVADRESLYLVHHPAGQPQKLTRIRCQAGRPAVNADKRLVHHCDTLGGSSGTAIFAMTDGAFAGLHHSGVPDNVRPYNMGTPAADLVAASAELRRIVGIGNGGGSSVAPVAPVAHAPAEGGFTPLDLSKAAFAAAAGAGPRETRLFQDCSTCPEMVAIPAGGFLMGSPENEPGHIMDERLQRQVSVKTFAAGRYEVTVGEYQACVSAGACRQPEWLESGSRYNITTGSDTGYKEFGNALTSSSHPIVGVAWTDAVAYAKWLSVATGRSYRLLSEAEWEYAARATTTGPYSFGGTIINSLANFSGGPGKPTVAGQYPANRFGLHDMHGNVAEWTQDCYVQSYAGLAIDGAAFEVDGCEQRTVRGGSWLNRASQVRSAYRSSTEPSRRGHYLGFRVARAAN